MAQTAPAHNRTDWRIGLNAVQEKIVRTTEGPVLVFAGAGSGKTRVITHRIGYLLLERGVHPDAILALTFTKKAAGEMQQRIAQLLGTSGRPLRWMGTFHSCLAQILRRESRHLGFKSPFVIVDQDDRKKLLKHLLDRWPPGARILKPQQAAAFISRMKSQPHLPLDQICAAMHQPALETLYQEYQQALQDSCGLDFDDLLVRPLALFRERPDILAQYQAKFKYIFVDEFQDTNIVQYDVLKLLAGERENLCAVGDDDQSIYGWRGAEVKNILRFQEDFPRAQVFRLEQNYRSTGNILAAAQSVISHNVVRQKKQLRTQRPVGELCALVTVENEQAEGRWIATEIERRIRERGTPPGHFAVLYRTNAQSRALEEGMRRATIPYTIVGGTRFYERKEIKDVIAYLQLIQNPRATTAILRIINFPSRHIGDATLDKLTALSESLRLPLFETIPKMFQRSDLPQGKKDALKQFHALITKYRDVRKTLSLPEWTRTLVDELGLKKLYRDENTVEADTRWENIGELLNGLSEFAKTEEDSSLEAFLQHVSLLSDIDQWRQSPEAVSLMTLHSAKGLEFDTVFMTGLEEGLFPMFGSMDTPEALEEERRLFYVGSTRAKDKLYMMHARTRHRYGQLESARPSRFLQELAADCIETIEAIPHPSSRRTRSPTTDSAARSRRAALAPSKTGQKFAVGRRVHHESFGAGTITNVQGSGEETCLQVQFAGHGVKKLLVKYANLSVL